MQYLHQYSEIKGRYRSWKKKPPRNRIKQGRKSELCLSPVQTEPGRGGTQRSLREPLGPGCRRVAQGRWQHFLLQKEPIMLPAQLPEKPAPVSVFGVGSSVAEAPTAEQMSPRSGRGSVGPRGTGSTGSRGPVRSVAAPCGVCALLRSIPKPPRVSSALSCSFTEGNPLTPRRSLRSKYRIKFPCEHPRAAWEQETLGICPPSSTEVFLPPSCSPPKRPGGPVCSLVTQGWGTFCKRRTGAHPGNNLIAGLLHERIISPVLVLSRSSSLWGLSYFPYHEKCKGYLGPVFPLFDLRSSH